MLGRSFSYVPFAYGHFLTIDIPHAPRESNTNADFLPVRFFGGAGDPSGNGEKNYEKTKPGNMMCLVLNAIYKSGKSVFILYGTQI